MEDARIVELYWERDEAAIAESSAKYGGYCYQIAFRILALREDAEECVQDAVWAFVEGRAPWDPAQGSKQTWLCVLVRSRAKDRRRALAARMEEPLEEHSGLAAADHAERAAVRDGLRRVLEGLSREERRLFTLRFVYGLSSAELGGVLGLSPNGVDARVSRLRKKLKRLLARLTATPLLGVLTGLAVTAVLQSSSAATVMVIGFVSAGLLALPRAVAIIYGINIGTTMTAQLVAFDVQTLVYPVLFLGFLLDFAARRPRWQAVGEAVFSFGLLFEGIDILGRALQPLAGQAVFLDWMTRVKESPLLGILLGLSMTMVVQSSSATIALLQNVARQAGPDGIHSVLGLAGAVPVLLGDNIGTTVTALLACIGQGKDAARAALDAKQAEYDARLAVCREQLRAMQRLDGGRAVWLLAQAKSLYQLLTFDAVLQQMSARNSTVLAELDAEAAALEQARADKTIGKSLEAEVDPTVTAEDAFLADMDAADLADTLIVSQVRVDVGAEQAVAVRPAAGAKCLRCWKVLPTVGSDAEHPELCPRCAAVVKDLPVIE